MKISPILFLLVLLGLNSCMQIEPLAVKTVTCCELKKALKSETEVAFSIELSNPNPFPINIKKYDLDVRINGNTIGTTENTELTAIPANSTVEKTISVTASTEKLMSGTLMMGLSALLKNDPTTLEIEVAGYVVGSAKGLSKRVRIHEKYPLKMHP
ncbi:MAG: LEA type 2 family protein [Flavobacteriales bacterium]|nr:LEA type 2 family protein [Flavobacteriales bacterium]